VSYCNNCNKIDSPEIGSCAVSGGGLCTYIDISLCTNVDVPFKAKNHM